MFRSPWVQSNYYSKLNLYSKAIPCDITYINKEYFFDIYKVGMKAINYMQANDSIGDMSRAKLILKDVQISQLRKSEALELLEKLDPEKFNREEFSLLTIVKLKERIKLYQNVREINNMEEIKNKAFLEYAEYLMSEAIIEEEKPKAIIDDITDLDFLVNYLIMIGK